MALFKKGKANDADPIPPEKEKDAPPAAEAPADAPAEQPAPGAAPVAPAAGPVAPAAEAAPAVAGAAAPVAQAAMEVSQMPDDVSSLDDPNLLLCLNGIVKALKALMPGEVAEPQHQEAPVAQDSDIDEEDKDKLAKDGDDMAEDGDDEDMTDDGVPAFAGKAPGVNDSIFKMPMTNDSTKTKGLGDFVAGLYKKGAK